MNASLPRSQTIDGLELRLTCPSHPEQYNVYEGMNQVAYFRLRNGVFSVDIPRCGDGRVYQSMPEGDGLFKSHERQHFLTEAVKAVRQWQSRF